MSSIESSLLRISWNGEKISFPEREILRNMFVRELPALGYKRPENSGRDMYKEVEGGFSMHVGSQIQAIFISVLGYSNLTSKAKARFKSGSGSYFYYWEKGGLYKDVIEREVVVFASHFNLDYSPIIRALDISAHEFSIKFQEFLK